MSWIAKPRYTIVQQMSAHYNLLLCLQGFDDHIKHDHNMWDYIYYSIYLDTIDISDHNAIESYVYKMVLNGSACTEHL